MEKKEIVMNTALDLFVNQGFQQTSMAQISKISGIAVGTIYHHFESKNDLINSLYLKIKEEFGAFIQFEKSEKELSIRDRFEALWKKSYQFYIENPNKFIFDDSIIYSPLITNEVRSEGRKYYMEAIKFIQEAMDKKVFFSTEIILLMRAYYNSVRAVVQIQIAREIEVTDELIQTAIDMCWKGMTLK